ncbi:hypothetical protein CGLO_05599 [Colletotrichum gloeosporioides Cg-14]|uniref:Uncharacterized protein n=1 Tax=Colletotrichum gloeosporioides (strain Cg-14) TaxID=1237896 RepID=T0M1C6_COLGC|nr:hypothetical protein CGLO_05599 [Colletotrichum gloeosporioides Cg-14]
MSGYSLSRWRQRWLIAPIIVANVPSTLAQGQFENFFQGWDSIIKDSLEVNCSKELEGYKNNPSAKWPVVDCILDDFSESRKAEGAAAALTFGLAPMVLQNIGPNTSETSLLFMRRPLLALLIAISSPWPRNPDSKVYDKIVKQPTAMNQPEVQSDEWSIWPAENNKPIGMMVLFVEYAMALGAAANVALLSYQLGHWAFFASANNTYDPVLFTYCSLLIHLVGIFSMFLSFREPERTGGTNWFERWLVNEFRPAAQNSPLRLTRRKKEEVWIPLRLLWKPLKFFLTWLLSIAPTLQVLMGTIMLSGSLLTAQVDARDCLFRYIASTIVARALLQYELSCLTRKDDTTESQANSHEKTETGLSTYTLIGKPS